MLNVKQLGQCIFVILLPTSDELQNKIFNSFVGRINIALSVTFDG